MVIALCAPTVATAHDSYPYECCGGMDCGPVSHMETVPAPSFASMTGPARALPSMTSVTIMLSSGTRTAILPPDLPRRESPDGQTHACISATGRLVCFFVPPSM